MASQPDYLEGQTQNKGINHAIRGPDFTPCVVVINNLIGEIKIKKPDTSQQGDDQIKTNNKKVLFSVLVPRATITGNNKQAG